MIYYYNRLLKRCLFLLNIILPKLFQYLLMIKLCNYKFIRTYFLLTTVLFALLLCFQSNSTMISKLALETSIVDNEIIQVSIEN